MLFRSRVEHGIEVGQTETTMSMEMTEEMVSCTGDLTLAAECEGADITSWTWIQGRRTRPEYGDFFPRMEYED